MSRCIALVQSGASTKAWDRCPQIALRGDCFCTDHRHALDGAVMGFLDTKAYRHANTETLDKVLEKTERARKKRRGRRGKVSPQVQEETRSSQKEGKDFLGE